MKNIYRFLFFGIGLLILALVVNFFVVSSKTKEYSYGDILKQDSISLSIFKDLSQSRLTYKNGFGNNSEQIFTYDYWNNYNLIIWKIDGFSEVEPLNIKLFNNFDFDKIEINPQHYSLFSDPQVKLSSKIEILIANNITLHFDKNYSIIDSKKDSNFIFLNIESNGFALADSFNNYKVKVEFEERLHYNLSFINQDSIFQILLLTGKGNSIIEENLLFDMLKLD